MQMHKKTKIEILIEALYEEKLVDRLKQLGVTGHTIYPVVSGKGEHGSWSRHGVISDVGQMLLFVVIVEPNKAREISEQLYKGIADHLGVITVSEVEVFRGEKF